MPSREMIMRGTRPRLSCIRMVFNLYGTEQNRPVGVEYSLLQLFSDYLEKTKAKGFEAAELPAAFEVIRRK